MPAFNEVRSRRKIKVERLIAPNSAAEPAHNAILNYKTISTGTKEKSPSGSYTCTAQP